MKKTFPIFLAFLCMGFGDAVTTFVNMAKNHFSLNNFEANFVAFAGLIMFGILSVPMGIIQGRIGRKNTLLTGLGVALTGILVVAFFGLSSYAIFLCALLLLGAGATILQVSGNPIMRDVSDEGKYSGNLSLAQFIKAIGSFTAPVIFFTMHKMGYTETQSWTLLFPIFAIALVISIICVATLKLEKRSSGEESASIASTLGLLKNPYVLCMVGGIFLYVGAEVSIASGMPIYFTEAFEIKPALATQYVMYFFVAIMFSRFAGAMLLKFIEPKKFLTLTSIVSLFGFCLLPLGFELSTTIALIVIALGFGNIFPLIFSITIDRMPEKSNRLSGLMVTAILGGAIIPPLMGATADILGILAGFTVPFLCTTYILAISLMRSK